MMFYDDIPIFGSVGNYSEDGGKEKYYLYTSYAFELVHNNVNVLAINVSAPGKVDITNGKEQKVEFTYSVDWKYLDKPFSERHDRFRNSILP